MQFLTTFQKKFSELRKYREEIQLAIKLSGLSERLLLVRLFQEVESYSPDLPID